MLREDMKRQAGIMTALMAAMTSHRSKRSASQPHKGFATMASAYAAAMMLDEVAGPAWNSERTTEGTKNVAAKPPALASPSNGMVQTIGILKAENSPDCPGDLTVARACEGFAGR